MHEQSLWIGEEQLGLKPPEPNLDKLADEHFSKRAKTEQAALFLAADLRDKSGVADTELLKGDIMTLLDAPHSHYSVHWEKALEEKFVHHNEIITLLAGLKDQVVLDVGCGPVSQDFQSFLSRFGSRGYIGVDTHSYFGPGRNIRRLDGLGDAVYLDEADGDKLDGIVIKGDMLRLVSRLPDGSVSIALNGIDEYVANTESPYGQRLAAEIKRVLDPNGMIIGITGNGGVLDMLAADPDFQTVILRVVPGTSISTRYYFLKRDGGR